MASLEMASLEMASEMLRASTARFVKLTNRRCEHRGVRYNEGLVVLSEKFDPMTEHGNGLFFTRMETFHLWTIGAMDGKDAIMYYLWDVELPMDAKVVQISDTCYKADRLVIRNQRCIWNDPVYCIQVLQSFGFLLEYVHPRLKTSELCSIAVAQNGFSLRFVPEEMITEKLCLTAIEQDSRVLSIVPPDVITKEMCVKVVEKSPLCLQFVPDKFIDEELCIKAVSQFGAALQYVPMDLRTKKVCQIAFTNDLTSFLALARVPERTIDYWKERLFEE